MKNFPSILILRDRPYYYYVSYEVFNLRSVILQNLILEENTKRKQTERKCLSSCGKAGFKVFMESQPFLLYGHSATIVI